MKKVFLCICAALLTTHCFGQTAQTDKNVVYDCVVGKIDYQEPVKKSTGEKLVNAIGAGLTAAAGGDGKVVKDEPAYAQRVREAILAGVKDARRVSLLYGEPNGEHPVLNLNGNITAIQSIYNVYTQKGIIDNKEHVEDGYRASITGTATLTNAQTGRVVAAIDLAYKGFQLGWQSDVDKAMQEAITNVQKTVAKALNEALPLYAKIIEGSSAKKDKQKEVYIDLGVKAGVTKGMQFYVYQTTTVAGQEARKEIGRIKISEVMGDDISLCKVSKGGKDIKEAVDAGVELQITSKE